MIRTLVVDDSDLIRVRLKGILIKAGCEIVGEASDGKKAVEVYKQVKPELVTLDISMPGQNGIETLKQIVNIGDDTKVVIISAMEQKALIMEALKEGAGAFIVKPFRPEQITGKITKLFGETTGNQVSAVVSTSKASK